MTSSECPQPFEATASDVKEKAAWVVLASRATVPAQAYTCKVIPALFHFPCQPIRP